MGCLHILCLTFVCLKWIFAQNLTNECHNITGKDGMIDLYCQLDEWNPADPLLPQKIEDKRKINGLQIIFEDRVSTFRNTHLKDYDNLRWISLVDRNYFNNQGFVKFSPINVFRYTPKLEKFYSNVATPNFDVLPSFQTKIIPIENFEIRINCSTIESEAFDFMKPSVQTLVIVNKCVIPELLYLNSKTFASYSQLKTLELEFFTFLGTHVSPYAVAHNSKLEVLKLQFTRRIIFSGEPILLYDLPSLRSVHLQSLMLYEFPQNIRICGKLSDNIHEVKLENTFLHVLSACPDLWMCKNCGENDIGQLMLINRGMYVPTRSSTGEYMKLKLSEILPNHDSEWYRINTTHIEIYNTDLYLDDFSRFYQLTHFTHIRGDIYDVSSYYMSRIMDCPPLQGINPFKSLPNPRLLQVVSLSFEKCDCDVYATKLWFKNNLPNTKLNLFCANFDCGEDKQRDYEWIDDQLFIKQMSLYCESANTINVTNIPNKLVDCSGNVSGRISAPRIARLISVLLCYISFNYNF